MCLLIAAPCINFFFAACCTTNCGVPDPYIVAESRQKENFYYVPSSHHAPLLKNKNDLSVALQHSASNKHSGGELQAAYVASKHLGILSNLSWGGNKRYEDMNYWKWEMGAGYILPVTKYWHFESYGGVGTGKIDNHHHTGKSIIKNNYLFLQPAIAVSNLQGSVQFGFVSKFIGNRFSIGEASLNKDREPFTSSQLQLIEDNPFQLFWEPGFIFRFGWKNFLFHTGYSISADLTKSDLHRAKDNFSIGMYLKFNTGK